MSLIKKWAFKHFQKIEEKERKKREENDSLESENQKPDLSQPLGEKAPDLSDTDAKKAKRNSIIKKTLWIGGTLAVVGTIIGVSVYFATKEDYNSIIVKNISVNSENNKLIDINDGTRTYTINPETAYISSTPITSTITAYILKTTNSSLPIRFQAGIISSDKGYTFNFGGDVGSINYDYGRDQNGSITNEAEAKFYSDCLVQGLVNAQIATGGFNWMGLISLFIPFITIGLLFWMYSRVLKSQMGGIDNLMSNGKPLIKNTKTSIKFEDVGGIGEVKEELNEIVDFIRRPQKYAEMGARCPKGVILYGPPGTGKTLIAKAVAGEANCNFYPISGSSFDDMFVGSGVRRVKELFNTARKNAPSIIFIDEIDSVAGKRGQNNIVGGGSGIADQTINQLLAEMDGFNSEKGIIVIAATNRLDSLDEAILRPGRFDRQIQVSLPDIKEREAILKIHSKSKKLSKNVNMLEVARRTPGFSGAQLENILNESALLAVRENKTVISMHNVDEAIDRTIGGPKRQMRVMTETEKKQIAYHEAGHALVGLHTENSPEVVQKITIIPRGNAAGYTLQTPQEQERQIQSKQDILNNVRMTLGGRAAEEIIFGENAISTGAANDLYKVTGLVKAMVAQLGMTNVGMTQFIPTEGNHSQLEKFFSDLTHQKIDDKIEEIIQEQYKSAKEIIANNRKELDLIVETLLILETIVKEEIDYIHTNLKLPPSAIEAKERMNRQEEEFDEEQNKDN
ncbi:MAG: ATP-dependent zinc metalloprotease FtsH [Ureaplasma sp.]|nr:ATP-dependent zinc metalloprotease FtsH [Ureaplasma sp.]